VFPLLRAMRKRIVIFPLMGLLGVVVGATIVLLVWQAQQMPKAGSVKIALVSYLPPRTAQVAIESPKPVVVWGPSRVERKGGGPIVVGAVGKTVAIVSGNSGATSWSPIGNSRIELTGRDHGPWRARISVSGYGLWRGLEKLLGKPPGWIAKSSMFGPLLRRSGRVIVSDWIEEPPMNSGFNGGAFAGPVTSGGSGFYGRPVTNGQTAG